MATVDTKHPRRTQKSGGRASYRVRWTDADDRDREKWVLGLDAAKKEAARITTELDRGTLLDDRKARMTLGEVADEWLLSLFRPRPATVAEYRRLLDTRVFGPAGHFDRRRAVGTIKPPHVNGYLRYLAAAGLAPASIERAFHPLRAVLRYAMRAGYIPASPAEDAELPEPDDHAARFLVWPEVESLAAAADRRAPSTPAGLIVRFAAITGLRAGEIAGLNVGDVTMVGPNGTVAVRRTRKRTAGGWTEGKPKSKRGVRDVPILRADVAGDLAAYLAIHPRRDTPAAPLFFGRLPAGDHSTPDPSRPWDPGTFYKRTFIPAATAAGLGAVRFHDLRHTAASLWANAGVEMLKVSRWLGHFSISITDQIYAHLYPTDAATERAAVERLTAQQERTAEEAGSNVVQFPRVS